VPGSDRHVENGVERVARFDRPNPDARHHQLVDFGIRELDDAVDHLLLVLLYPTLLGPGLDEQLELLGRQVPCLRLLGAAESADQEPGDE
jgi:hypothetical protein